MATSKKPRKGYNPRKLCAKGLKPTIFEGERVFTPVRQSIESLRGEVMTIKGYPAFIDWKGYLSRIDEALLGWVECWERIAPQIDQQPLRKLYKLLKAGAPIFEDQLVQALDVIDRQQAIWTSLKVDFLKDKVTAQLISIELEKHGIIEEATC